MVFIFDRSNTDKTQTPIKGSAINQTNIKQKFVRWIGLEPTMFMLEAQSFIH